MGEDTGAIPEFDPPIAATLLNTMFPTKTACTSRGQEAFCERIDPAFDPIEERRIVFPAELLIFFQCRTVELLQRYARFSRPEYFNVYDILS